MDHALRRRRTTSCALLIKGSGMSLPGAAVDPEVETADVLDYLRNNYITLDELSARTGLAVDRIVTFATAECIPGYSHAVRLTLAVNTRISGEFRISDRELWFFHPDVAEWVLLADAAYQACRSLEATARQIRQRFERDVELALGKPASECAEAVEANWREFLAGTFGVCLKRMRAADMIQKQRALYRIEKLLVEIEQHVPSPDQVDRLRKQIERYNGVASAFGPHEVATSSRGTTIKRATEVLNRSRDGDEPHA
jgi:predicted transposase YbfD/YdcC